MLLAIQHYKDEWDNGWDRQTQRCTATPRKRNGGGGGGRVVLSIPKNERESQAKLRLGVKEMQSMCASETLGCQM